MLVGSIVLAAALAGAQGKPTATEPRPQGTMICKTRPQTGSRFPTKMCRTAAQWETVSEQNRRDMKETADRPFIFDCRASGQQC